MDSTYGYYNNHHHYNPHKHNWCSSTPFSATPCQNPKKDKQFNENKKLSNTNPNSRTFITCIRELRKDEYRVPQQMNENRIR